MHIEDAIAQYRYTLQQRAVEAPDHIAEALEEAKSNRISM